MLPNKPLKQTAAPRRELHRPLSPVVKYHGLARRHWQPYRLLMRPLLNGGTLAGLMKKRSGIQRAVAMLERDRLDSLSTKQLAARLARLRFCEESAEVSDLTPEEIGAVRGILFKRSPEWRTAFADLRKVLATREHVARTPTQAAVPRRRQR